MTQVFSCELLNIADQCNHNTPRINKSIAFLYQLYISRENALVIHGICCTRTCKSYSFIHAYQLLQPEMWNIYTILFTTNCISQ